MAFLLGVTEQAINAETRAALIKVRTGLAEFALVSSRSIVELTGARGTVTPGRHAQSGHSRREIDLSPS